MLENFNEDKRKNSMTQFSDFHTGWSIAALRFKILTKIKGKIHGSKLFTVHIDFQRCSRTLRV